MHRRFFLCTWPLTITPSAPLREGELTNWRYAIRATTAAPRAPRDATVPTRRIRPPATDDTFKRKRERLSDRAPQIADPRRYFRLEKGQFPLITTDPLDTNFPPSQQHPQQRIEKKIPIIASRRAKFVPPLQITELNRARDKRKAAKSADRKAAFKEDTTRNN